MIDFSSQLTFSKQFKTIKTYKKLIGSYELIIDITYIKTVDDPYRIFFKKSWDKNSNFKKSLERFFKKFKKGFIKIDSKAYFKLLFFKKNIYESHCTYGLNQIILEPIRHKFFDIERNKYEQKVIQEIELYEKEIDMQYQMFLCFLYGV